MIRNAISALSAALSSTRATRVQLAVAMAILASLAWTPPLAACGPYDIVAYFWLDREPGPARDAFLQGDLGILMAGHRLEYRYIAYRHLTGLEEGRDNSDALASIWPPPGRIATEESPDRAWIEARNRVPGIEPMRWLSRSRNREVQDGDSVYYQYFYNCLDDALRTAAATLSARIERFGVASREVRAWVDAQDQVFANCSAGESIPPSLDESWDPLLRADRAYQIAAAHFYATDYIEAERLFRAISKDSGSPWRDLSAYLVARAQIRGGRFADAERELQHVIAAPSLAAMHEPAQRLQGFVSLRNNLGERHRELTERLLAPALEAPLRQTFIDYRWSLDHETHGNELARWFLATARTVKGDSALRTWEPEQGPAWLAAALATATPQTTVVESVLEAAAQVPENSFLYPTAAYHRGRLLIGLERPAEAREVLDTALQRASDRLAPADLNRLRFLRAEVTPELDEYLRLVAAVPLGLAWDDGSGRPLTSAGQPESVFPFYRLSEPMLPSSAIELLNHGLTEAEMLELAQSETLPEGWRRRLVLATWTRAVVTGSEGVAVAAVPLVGQLVPELADEVTAYLDATGSDRRFAAAWTLLRFPGLSPIVRWGVGRRTPLAERDSLRDNGWCEGVLQVESLPSQIVRDAEQIAAVQADLPADGLPASPNYLGQIVLLRAESHPDDPRLPEALHRVVQATRYGCPMGGYKNTSRAAFQTLHRQFPSSPWTEKTPYWYE